MSTLYTHKEENIWKTWGLMTIFFILVIGLGWAFSVAYNAPQVLYGAIIFSILMNVGSYWFSDKLVIKMAGAVAVTREQYPDYWNTVENLSITAGLPMPKIYVINDPAPNAFATGRDAVHAAVAATSGLLAMMSKTELEGVLAHELSHIGNRDMLLSTIVVVLVGFITLLSDFFLRIGRFGGNDRDNKAAGAALLIGIVLAILSPIAATLIQLAISRKREFLADASGALLTRYPEGLASALEKIGKYSQPMIHANNAIAHLYISNPFGKQNGLSGLAKLFMTHPAIEERVKALREMEA